MGETATYNAWLHRYAVLTASCTFLLLISGGLVTSTGSGLAVPDWPLSYGMFFPPMVGGILYEHGHRMVAGTVGIMTMILALWVWQIEPRRWVRRLAAAAVVAVLGQASLGGLTVIFLLPTVVSVAHAGLAMGFFSIVCTLQLVTSRSWLGSVDREHLSESPGSGPLPRLAMAATLAIYAQILIGAVVRHTGSGLACPDFPLCNGQVVPSIDSFGVALQLTHRLGAVAVAGMVIWVYRLVSRSYATVPGLVIPTTIALTLLAVQFLLGALTVWNALAVEPTTAHVGVGALLLVAMLTLTLRTYRQYSCNPAASVSTNRKVLA